jgi:hypothetical protein
VKPILLYWSDVWGATLARKLNKGKELLYNATKSICKPIIQYVVVSIVHEYLCINNVNYALLYYWVSGIKDR